jgi:hypothetical protein
VSHYSGYRSSLNHFSVLHPKKTEKQSTDKNKLSLDHAAKNAIKFVSSNKKYLESAAKKFNKKNPNHSRQMSDIFFVTSDSASCSPLPHNRSMSNHKKEPSVSNMSYPTRDGK